MINQNQNNGGQNNFPGRQQVSHRHRPENKDDLDSRSGEEQENFSGKQTHNIRDTKEGHLKDRGKDKHRQ